MHKLNPASFDLNLLRVFHTIYRERHLTRAANALCLSQPAVSHALARLREALGDDLFVRTANGFEPTARATRFAPLAARGVDALQEALNLFTRFDPATAQVDWRLALTDLSSVAVLPGLVQRLRQDAPHANLRVLDLATPQVRAQLDEGSIDCAIIASGDHPSRFVSRHVFSDPFVCLVSRRNRRVGRRLDLDTFVALPHVLVLNTREPRGLIDQLLEQRGLRRRVALSVPILMGVPALLADSDFIATVPRSIAADMTRSGELREYPLPLERGDIEYHLVWHARDASDPARRWFRERVEDCCGVARQRLRGRATRARRGLVH